MKTELQIQVENISGLIHFIRGEKVLLDYDLATLYGIEVKRLKQSVRRNIKRFPTDFFFELSPAEQKILRTQIVSSSWGGSRYQVFAFTEQGVAMLSGILNSDRAIQVNIAIMRAFVQLRRFLETNKKIIEKVDELEKKVSIHDENILLIFETIRQMIEPKNEPRKPLGYKIGEGERG
jgi:hypothetical protein